MNNKSKFIQRTLNSKERLNEVASLLVVAIGRLQIREREEFSKNSLDFSFKSSVTAHYNQKWGDKLNE